MPTPSLGDTTVAGLQSVIDDAIAKSTAVAEAMIKFGAEMSVVHGKNHVGKASQLS